ncbi:actin depolymerizing factor 5 [Actinidia rufa]|uniref:Actin depolymerizing factor 5 n=1 Tax=Actinidia rufa TaxID=165716 RepID=A0A7J0DQ20_9ERIC|nr:actin depolymerizing factor 5 [Actinidia rufa]GFS38738.1 actin depolymerizing factor 5 [Actinidia rufa]
MLRYERDGPGNEKDLAFVAIIDGDEVEIEDGVAAVVVRQRGGEVVVTLGGAADFIDGEQSRDFVDLEDDVPVDLPPLHLHERVLALLRHPHPRRRL